MEIRTIRRVDCVIPQSCLYGVSSAYFSVINKQLDIG
jgi:hypothetical protein